MRKTRHNINKRSQKTTSHKLPAKKSLGQHFLTSLHYVRLIADAARLQKGETVLEIGPGTGVLTRELLARGAKVTALEKDRRLIPILQNTFAEEIASGQLRIAEMDALEFEPSFYKLKAESYKLIANIPYYITGALLRKFLTSAQRPSHIVFLVQKEVAQRIVGNPERSRGTRSKKESVLSLSVKAFGEPRYCKTVPRGAFAPAPAVDSAILSIENVSNRNFADEAAQQRFFDLIHAGFSSKRKLLRRNLEKVLGDKSAEMLAAAEIGQNARAEDVPLKNWLLLAAEAGA